MAALRAHAADEGFAPLSAGGGRFQLLDRNSKDLLDKVISSTSAPAEDVNLDEFSDELPFKYSDDAWNSAREAAESGGIAAESSRFTSAVETSSAAPLSPEPQVEFKDSGTSLSVTGRKVIALNYSGKTYLKDQTTTTRPKTISLFEITQQMQVKMQGKVGQKISVNVDYDDTKTDKQDISVVYQGDPNEVVQNVSFGDIDLSLPSTEFVSYNKQLFGIRADIKTNRLKMTFVGSRTKGETKTKQFTGNTQFQKLDIYDVTYLRRKYYDVTFGNTARLPVKAGSEKIYIDRQTSEAVDNVTVFPMTADDLAVQTSSYTGRFKLMSRGVDYVMDYANGIITFSGSLNSNDVVIINFTNNDGSKLAYNSSAGTLDTAGTGNYKILKVKDDIRIASASETGYRRELKTYYQIGQTNIVRDNGTGNFSLKVQDLSHNEVGSSLNPKQTYSDNIIVDFEQGIFHLVKPFAATDDPAAEDPLVYAASPSSKRLFHIEYYYRFKTFTLDTGIVLNSEVVRVDNVKYTRNTDYFIDYDSGFITFYYPEKIGQEAKIDISYEVSQFGGTGNQSLVGGRVSYDLTNHFSLGSTMLYQGGIKSNTVPNVTDLVNSMLVYEGDAQLKGLNLLGLRASLGGEVAQSKTTPNLNDYALVDNMEGIKQEDTTPLDKNYWAIAATPGGDPADPTAITWDNENIKAKEINSQAASDGTQQVLTLHYDFSISSEVSVVYPLSTSGMDFSGKTMMELVLHGENDITQPGVLSGPEIDIHYGQIDEDADGNNGRNYVCSSGLSLYNYPKSEDLNCDGQVGSSEDTGWVYSPAGKNSRRYGASNGRLDSEDLNGNGRLDAQDLTGGSFGYTNGTLFTHNSSLQSAVVNFSGWRTLSTPMLITSTDSYKWTAIKQVRISLKQSPGGATSGYVKFARIAAVGNTWTVAASTTGGTMQVEAINNIDNTDYVPIYNAGGEATQVFTDLYGSVSSLKQQNNTTTVSEQTLRMNYSAVTSTSTGYVYRTFTTALDISQHKKLRFLVRNDAIDTGASMFLKAGSDSTYFKASVPLDFTGWRLIEIDQYDATGDNIPDYWVSASNYGVTVSSVGSPTMQQISQFRVGIEATDGNPHSGTVYFDELHLKGPIARTGSARKVEGTLEVPGWFTAGGKHKYVDRGFQTPVTSIANQDNETSNAYLNLTRISFFPVSMTAARQITVTPNAAVTGSNNLVTGMQEGRVKKFDGTAAGTLSLGFLPKIGLNYTKGVTEYNTLSRKDDKDTYAANLSYNLPGSIFFMPRTVAANYSLGRSLVDYDPTRINPAAYTGLYNTDERTDIYGGKLTFVPWKGTSLNPGYSLQTVQETRTPLNAPDTFEHYPKSMQQTVDFNSNLLFARWLNPSVNYTVTTIESNNLSTTTVTVATNTTTYPVGDIKTVTRSAQGGVSLAFNMNDIMPSSRLLRSLVLSSNYQIQDGDSWYYVEKDYNTRNQLWLRRDLKPKNAQAQHNSLTLRDTVNSNQRWQPLEGYKLNGRWAALNTLSLTNNFTNTVQRSEVTGTSTRTKSRTFPDAIVSLSQLETLTNTKRWAQNATANIKYSDTVAETVDVSRETTNSYSVDLRFKLLGTVDTATSYNLKLYDYLDMDAAKVTKRTRHDDATLQGTFDYRKFRLTPKLDYSADVTKGALGTKTGDTRTITPSVLIKTDLSLPKGLKIPFTNRTLAMINRIVWTTTISYAMKSSPITAADNNKLFSLTSSADYEVAKNLRLTLNAGMQRLWSKKLPEEEYLSYQAGSTLTFQF